MRGEGQIAELAAIAEPDVGVIVNVGPVHLELLGTVERVAAAKAELIRDLRPGAACVRARRASRCSTPTCATTSTPGPSARRPGAAARDATASRAEIEARGERDRARAALLGAAQPAEHAGRGGRGAGARGAGRAAAWTCASPRCGARSWSCPGGVVVVNDCYNANPMSMRAALDHLAESPAERRIAVLGTMAELGRGLAGLPPRDRRARGGARGRRAGAGGRGGARLHRGLRRRDAPGGHARGGRRAARGAGPPGRPGARQGLALGRAWNGCSPRRCSARS